MVHDSVIISFSIYFLLGLFPLALDIPYTKALPKGIGWIKKTTQTNVGSISVSAAIAGSSNGQRVVFIHGSPGEAGVWAGFLANVPKGFEFVAVDRPGFGRSITSEPTNSLQSQAQALRPFLYTADNRPVLVVGHSFGGCIAATLAALYPDRVAGMLQVAGLLNPYGQETRLVQYVVYLPPFRWTFKQYLFNSNAERMDLGDELKWLEPKLAHIKIPVTIFHAKNDRSVAFHNVSYMKKRLGSKDITLKIYSGDDHFLPWSQEPDIRTAIKRLSSKVHPKLEQP
ncbi:MAG: alpha/beta hydrolase [Spirochaetota bacterium]